MDPAKEPPDDLEPVYFWRPHEHNGYLSQWYPSPILTPSPLNPTQPLPFATAETYMMYHKALLFEDPETAAQILRHGSNPRKVKALGRKVRGFDEEVWQRERFGIVVRGNRLKFLQNGELGEKLRDTRGRELVEASPLDGVWGIGVGRAAAEGVGRENWWGMNLLGKALMVVREELLLGYLDALEETAEDTG